MSTSLFIIVVILAYAGLYLSLYYLLPRLIGLKHIEFGKPNIYSLITITLSTLALLAFILSIGDIELGNRLQHALAGGFMAYAIYALAIRDSGVRMSILQVAILGILTVTTLGVGVELLEYALELYTGHQFATSINDTQLDLLSNTAGIAMAVIVHIFVYKYRSIINK